MTMEAAANSLKYDQTFLMHAVCTRVGLLLRKCRGCL